MAIEDSVCLAECLATAESASDIPKALKVYEAIRKPRTKLISDFGESMAHTWQLPDGEEQKKRDEIYRQTPYFATSNWDGKHVDDLPGLPPDPLFFPYLLAHDVIEFVSGHFLLRQIEADYRQTHKQLEAHGLKAITS